MSKTIIICCFLVVSIWGNAQIVGAPKISMSDDSKYEYKIYSVSCIQHNLLISHSYPIGCFSCIVEPSIDSLNNLGKEGWQVISSQEVSQFVKGKIAPMAGTENWNWDGKTTIQYLLIRSKKNRHEIQNTFPQTVQPL